MHCWFIISDQLLIIPCTPSHPLQQWIIVLLFIRFICPVSNNSLVFWGSYTILCDLQVTCTSSITPYRSLNNCVKHKTAETAGQWHLSGPVCLVELDRKVEKRRKEETTSSRSARTNVNSRKFISSKQNKLENIRVNDYSMGRKRKARMWLLERMRFSIYVT